MNKIKIKVFVDRENKNIEMEIGKSAAVKDMLNRLKINPVTVLVSRGNELITEEEKLKDGDDIRILSVISGG